MSQAKKIILDLDGPILDGKEKHYRCYQSILEGFGIKPICIDKYWDSKRAVVNRRDLLTMSGAERFYDDFLTAWLLKIESPEMLALDKVQGGAIDCLRDWQAAGRELILVTMRKDHQALDQQLDSLSLRQFLDAILVCGHTNSGVGKAEAVCGYFHGRLKIDDMLWIGDTEADWEAAKFLGCGLVLVANGLRNEVFLNSLQGAVVAQSIASLNDRVLGRFNAS